jgi:hypothetical protein
LTLPRNLLIDHDRRNHFGAMDEIDERMLPAVSGPEERSQAANGAARGRRRATGCRAPTVGRTSHEVARRLSRGSARGAAVAGRAPEPSGPYLRTSVTFLITPCWPVLGVEDSFAEMLLPLACFISPMHAEVIPAVTVFRVFAGIR